MNRLIHLTLALLAAATLMISPTLVHAGEGHDHGEEPAAAGATALPRFAAVSELFELVGVLDGRSLTLYLDRSADNSPVIGARLDVELDGVRLGIEPHGDGEFHALLAQAPVPGEISVTATVIAGEQTDLLVGTLDLHDDAAHAQAPVALGVWQAGPGMIGAAIGGTAILTLLLWWSRRAGSRKSTRTASVLTCLVVGAMTINPQSATAGEGHDHGEAAPAAAGNGPRRLPDGSVFVPKPTQRQIGLRTSPVVREALSRTEALSGRVLMDPNAGGRVQATVAGRIEPGPRGLPAVGQTVKKGEVLAWVVPSSGAIERSNQSAQLAELRSARSLAERRLARLQTLADTVPRKEIDAARSEVTGLAARIAALGGGLSEREVLLAPVTGVIATAELVAGQVVEARELIFEVIDPQRLHVEALTYEPALARDIAGASIAEGDARITLAFIGAAGRLREQALPLRFSASGPGLANLVVGQPVKVFVTRATSVPAIRVPASALVKNPANETIVWVKDSPETFKPRVVTVAPLDGVTVAVMTGLESGDRVATAGATLVNQIR